MAADDPRVAAYQPSDFIDSRYLRELKPPGLWLAPGRAAIRPAPSLVGVAKRPR